MAPPATGDIVRPSPPDIVAREPISVIVKPNYAACGVTAPLKARAAAHPAVLGKAILITHVMMTAPGIRTNLALFSKLVKKCTR